jgi:quinoprotein glucose dehydrogenase
MEENSHQKINSWASALYIRWMDPVRLISYLSFLCFLGCKTSPPNDSAADLLTVYQDSASANKLAAEIKKQTSIKLAPGLDIQVWATDSLAPDPVAMDIDGQNAIYLTRTNRQKNSEFDIRGYPHWMTASISFQSVEDRRQFLHKTFAPEKSKENEWLADLNRDSLHDWRDLAVEKEEVWKLEDTDGDGMADKSTRVIHDFNTEVTDILAGILVREKDMFLTVGPDVWRMEDRNHDGIMEHKTSISTGYAVHIGFGGHNLSGIIEGPDGKIYWNIGDIGATITDKEGKIHRHPNEGLILRSNPDGSDFEVYAKGLRNTHEFVFDQYGNLISSDNDGDHRGESERLVHIVEGSDAGWRSNWQYGKYTDPKNNKYHVWMDEKLSIPRWPGQAAYIIPPIQNFHNGPTGMVYNPGTALGKAWLHKFFLVEFVGNPSNSHIWAFDLKPAGASFALNTDVDLVSGILPTGIRFGIDGALYAADWVNGWNTKNYGRVWKIDVQKEHNDLAAERQETALLLRQKFSTLTEQTLGKQLYHADQRVRLQSQFELARRKQKGAAIFRDALIQKTNQLARIHGIWGMGQLIRNHQPFQRELINLLNDPDEEIIAQSIKILGDAKVTIAAEAILPHIQSKNPRIQFFACQALGRIGFAPAKNQLVLVLEKNNDQDVYIRHAANLALSRVATDREIADLAKHPSFPVRLGAVLALRRLKSPLITNFLSDSSEYLVTEVARAINDDESIPDALPILAKFIQNSPFHSEALWRRCINAAVRVGTSENLDDLIRLAERKDVLSSIRAEAISAISTWQNPSVLDRVDGRFRGEITRDKQEVVNKIAPRFESLLASKDPQLLEATIGLAGALQIQSAIPKLESLYTTSDSAFIKVAALKSLNDLGYSGLPTLIRSGIKDPNRNVRSTALSLIDKINLSESEISQLSEDLLKSGTDGERQELLKTLFKMPLAKTIPTLEKMLDLWAKNQLPATVQLDLAEGIEKSAQSELIKKLNTIYKPQQPLEEYKTALYGGNVWNGYRIFNEHPSAQCIKCHVVRGAGSNVGPDLSKIGASLSREQLLEAMILPTARLAPGYGVVTLTLKDGTEVFGKLLTENTKEISIETAQAEPLKIPVSKIKNRKNIPSSMPDMSKKLTKREMRDVIEFLAAMK